MGAGPKELLDEESPDSDSSSAYWEGSDYDEDQERRRHCRMKACFWVITSSIACLVLCGLCTLVLAPVIGKFIAERVIGGVQISFTSIDIGTVNGTDRFFPHIVGKVSQPSPFPAVLYPMQAVLRASTGPSAGAREAEVVGTAAIPQIEIPAFQDVPLDLQIEFRVKDPAVFGRAGKHFIVAERADWSVEARADVKCWVFGLMPVVMKGITLVKPIDLRGLAGFAQDANPVTMDKVMDAYGEVNALRLIVVAELHNPSYMAAHIAQGMEFQVTQRGHAFGTASVEDLHLRPGRNVIPLKFLLTSTPTNEDAIRAFILGYIHAETQPVTVLGSRGATPDAFLGPILEGLNVTFNFRAPPTEFIRSVKASLGLGVKAHVGIYNPLPRAITMGDVDLNIREQNKFGKDIFRLRTQGALTNLPGAVLEPQQTSMLDISLNPFDAKLTDFKLIGRLIDAAQAGSLNVGVNGPVTITIQPSFTVTVDYASDNITAELDCPFLCG